MKKIKITHLTSAHPRYDTRIFLKMCTSLAKKDNYKISLIVADDKGDEIKNNINIVDVGANKGGRISRMTKVVNNVFNKAVELDSDIYHLHDPELISIGLKLKKIGKKVIFDAHEDLPKQILTKEYIHPFFRHSIAKIISLYEWYACRKFDFIITATKNIESKFLKFNNSSVHVANYPIVNELNNNIQWANKNNEVCFLGWITKERGINELVKALEYTSNIKLNLIGEFADNNTLTEVKKNKGWSNVNAFGFLNRKEASQILGKSKIGIVTFLPTPNHIDAQPNKMFEYMSAGLPVIGSHFPLWKEVIEGNKCGICVNPNDPKSLATAITSIIENPEKAKEMGENGKQAILEKYNWYVEEKKLLSVYNQLH